MAHVQPLPREALSEFEDAFKLIEQGMGFLPNSLLTMGRRPELLRAFSALSRAVGAHNDNVSPTLKAMVSHMASSAAGCRYCMAHTASTSVRRGIETEKIERLGAFETDPIFSEKERAALSFAAAAGAVPNAVEVHHFERLRLHFSDDDIVDIVAVIAHFGFLNRWNDTMATDLEEEPIALGGNLLKERGWEVGKHAAAETLPVDR